MRSRPARRLLRPVMFASVTAALLGGAVTAYGWSVASPSATVTIRSVSLPVGSLPVATRNGSTVSVTWPQVTIVPGVPVTSYRVIRTNNQNDSETACEATPTTSCVDSTAANGKWTYTVRPRQGTRWLGAAGPASNAVTVSNGGGKSLTSESGSAKAQPTPITETTKPEAGATPTPTATVSPQPDPTPDASPSGSLSPTPTTTTAAS